MYCWEVTRARRTPREDVQHQDDETNDAAASAVLRGVGAHGAERFVGDGRGVAQGREAELKE